jgi:AcrR family transcriptional regulator
MTAPTPRHADRPYHHGNLRRALLDAALDVIAARGAAAFSLRELAATVGVSHGAPAHHFGDKAGLLTAVAAEGFDLLAARLEAARGDAGEEGFLAVGLAYVAFAVDHPAHFHVMFDPSLYRADDPAVATGRARSGTALYGTAGEHAPRSSSADMGLAGWCLMHGVATLWLSGNLDGATAGGGADGPAADAVALARRVAVTAFR